MGPALLQDNLFINHLCGGHPNLYKWGLFDFLGFMKDIRVLVYAPQALGVVLKNNYCKFVQIKDLNYKL